MGKSSHPILTSQSTHTIEFTQAIGDLHLPNCTSMTRDHHVIWTYRFALFLKLRAHLAELKRRLSHSNGKTCNRATNASMSARLSVVLDDFSAP